MISYIVTLLVFFAVLYIILWWFGRYSRRIIFPAHQMKLVESLYLSPNKGLHLIAVGEKIILIGATEQKISLLQEINDPKVIDAIKEAVAARNEEPVSVPFSFIKALTNIWPSRKSKRDDYLPEKDISVFHKKLERKLSELKKWNDKFHEEKKDELEK